VPHPTDRRLIDEIRDALGSSLELEEVMAQVQPLLMQAVSADHAALGITKQGAPGEFEWIGSSLVPAFFAGYAEMAPHDFVRDAVVRLPNRVLRDTEMISRADLEANIMHRRARELGMPLEQVMSVMLHVDQDWSTGLSLYREKRRPFSERDRYLLQGLIPAFAQAIRNCRRFALYERRARIAEEVLARHHLAAIVLAPPAKEIARTEDAAALLERWFADFRSAADHLPEALAERIRAWTTRDVSEWVPSSFARPDLHAELRVTPHWLADPQRAQLVIVLEEVSHDPKLPVPWTLHLTPREQEVTTKVLLGWDNRLIADDIRCAPGTVKKHLSNIFDKLGVSNRAQLFVLAKRNVR
jgi:DNA-binding CsgD family transcriptional regulator